MEEDLSILATISSGIEEFAYKEVSEVLNIDYEGVTRRKGSLLFKISEHKLFTEGYLNHIYTLEHIYFVISYKEKFWGNNTKQSVETITNCLEEMILSSNYKIMKLMKIIENLRDMYPIFHKNSSDIVEEQKSGSEKNIFRVTVKDSGRLKEHKNTLGKRISEILESSNVELKADCTNYNHIFYICLINEDLYLSIALNPWIALSLTRVSKERELTEVALRPNICYTMSKLLEIQDGEIILDPMCGSSALLETASNLHPSTFYICGDIDQIHALPKSLINLNISKSFVGDIIRMDIGNLPFRTGCINGIGVDMPFGRKSGSHKLNKEIYPLGIREFARVLGILGRAVILSIEKKLLMASLGIKKYGMALLDTRPINMGGLEPNIFLTQRRLNKRQKKEIMLQEGKPDIE